MSRVMNSNLDAIEHDFEKLLRYAEDEKVILTPSQKLIPLRHVKGIMAHFEIKEEHVHVIGDAVFKKRDELEYPRFYFLDVLAISGGFLKVAAKGLLAKGLHWKTFFMLPPEDRKFLLVYTFRHSFDFENWFLRGGDFAEQIEKRSEMIWLRMLSWSDGKEVDWKSWAQEVIRGCGIRWNCIDQTHAEDLAIWGLGYCFLKPLEYFGLVDADRDGDDFARLRSVRLNQTGCDYFGRFLRLGYSSQSEIGPFSMN